jgi:predicted nuclease of predicted toxin-antitoxin system
MRLKFLVYVGVGRAVENLLIHLGYDTKAVRDINPSAKDCEILDSAVREDRMVVTMDKDFGEFVHKLSMPHSGVLILRMEAAKGAEKAEVVRELLAEFGNEIIGKFS